MPMSWWAPTPTAHGWSSRTPTVRVAVRRLTGRSREPKRPSASPSRRLQGHCSLHWARLTLQLAGAGAGPPLRAGDHLSEVILLQDGELARALADARLGPLRELPAGERVRLTETLAAWLAHHRHTPQIAEELHVHPQTVRYRVAKLRELLGDALDSPDGRFELQLALRIDAALSQRPARPAACR